MRSTNDTLTKYCTAAVAEDVLSNKTLRWSSPILFEDPFEPNHESPLSFDKSTLLSTAIKVASGLIFSRDQPKGETPLITAVRRWRDEERFRSTDEAEGVLKELLEKMVDARFSTLDKMTSAWANYNKKLRVCCFCSNSDNPGAWQKFADNHRGVAITFNTNEYGSFKKPTAVEYTNIAAEVTTIKEQMSSIIYDTKDRSLERFSDMFKQKPLVYKAEKELRCFQATPNALVDEDTTTWFDDIKFERSEVANICFGVNIDQAQKEQLLSIIESDFSAAKINQVTLLKGKYEIGIERIHGH